MATYSQGAQVEHSTFGFGTVLSHTEERIVIKFDDHGEKKFVTAIAITSLKKSDRQPPAEKRARRKSVKAAEPAAAAAEGTEAGEQPAKAAKPAKKATKKAKA